MLLTKGKRCFDGVHFLRPVIGLSCLNSQVTILHVGHLLSAHWGPGPGDTQSLLPQRSHSSGG